MFYFLTKTTTLRMTFLATILMTIGFGLVMHIWDFVIIDEMYVAETITEHLASMTPTQKVVHAWMTGTLDVAYPFAYGAFFIGMALRFYGSKGPYLALPSIAVIPVDLCEGMIQIMLLNGNESLLWLKEIVTPLKLGLFIIGLSIAIIGLLIAGKQFISNRPKTSV